MTRTPYSYPPWICDACWAGHDEPCDSLYEVWGFQIQSGTVCVCGCMVTIRVRWPYGRRPSVQAMAHVEDTWWVQGGLRFIASEGALSRNWHV